MLFEKEAVKMSSNSSAKLDKIGILSHKNAEAWFTKIKSILDTKDLWDLI
jgi:hypothetical protein